MAFFHDWYLGAFIETHHGGGWLRICLDCDIVQKEFLNKRGKWKWKTICSPPSPCDCCVNEARKKLE